MISKGKFRRVAGSERLIWNSRIEVNSIAGQDLEGKLQETKAETEDRARASRIEREILWAVIILYTAIIACFAGLHILGVLAE